MNPLVIALHGFVAMVDKTPADRDVKAGWPAFGLFIGLVLAVAVLGWSLTKHLKKAKLNADSGAFGDEDKPGS
jgi:hypothetical protein